MALTARREVKFYASRELVAVPVTSGLRILAGALVGRDAASGTARPLEAGDDYLGLAYTAADNTDGAGRSVLLHQEIDAVLPLAGVVAADLGADVYASDDEQLSLTASGNSRIGRIVALEPGGQVRVRLQPWPSRS